MGLTSEACKASVIVEDFPQREPRPCYTGRLAVGEVTSLVSTGSKTLVAPRATLSVNYGDTQDHLDVTVDGRKPESRISASLILLPGAQVLVDRVLVGDAEDTDLPMFGRSAKRMARTALRRALREIDRARKRPTPVPS